MEKACICKPFFCTCCMQNIEPSFQWESIYVAAKDKKSPFFGRYYSQTTYENDIYGYYIHPLWDDIGSETQRPLAIVVIGGLVTATLLTLVVLPALYVAWFSGPKAQTAKEKS